MFIHSILAFLLKFEFHCITEADGSGDVTKVPLLHTNFHGKNFGCNNVHPKKAYSRNWGHRGGIWDRIESCFSFNFTRPKINIFFMLAIACGMEYFVYLCSPFRSLREEIIFHRVATI